MTPTGMTASGEGHALESVPNLDEESLDGGWFEVAPDGADEGVDDPHGAPGAARLPRLRVARGTSREVLRRRRRTRLAVFAGAALSAASMFTLVAFHVFAAQAAFSLDKLDTKLSSEQREYGLLRNEVATLSSPAAVAKAAAALGMVRPPEVTLLNAPAAAAFGSGLPAPSPTPYTPLSIAPLP